MHVGLNLIFLVPGETGGLEIYARELIPALVDAAPGVRFTAFVNREAAAADGPWREIPSSTLRVNATHRVQWVAAEQALLPLAAMRARVDLLHSLGSTAPVWGRFRGVVTVHDLIYARFPEAHTGLRAQGMRILVPLAVRASDTVIAISRSTRDDLVELLGVDEQKISVVHQGLGSVRRAPSNGGDAATKNAMTMRLALGDRPLLLNVAAKRPHKNLGALIGALALIEPPRRPVLALVGYPTAHEATLRARASGLGVADDVRFLDWTAPTDLEDLWDAASAFVFPSLYEGFGLPVLEAMARGVPIACSDASSLPEVAGDAALLFDPHDESAIARAIERILGDEVLRATLRARGLARAAQFDWRRTADETLAVYESTLARSS